MFSIFFISMVVTLTAIYLIRPFAIHIGLVDSPDKRKEHKGQVPLVGGVGMFIGFSISTLIAHPDLNAIRELILAVSIIIAVGVLDDHHEISVKVRFFFQILVGLIMTTMAGVMLNSLGNLVALGEVALDLWAAPFSVIAIIGVMNALNMMDGIDGLAGMVALVTLAAVALLTAFHGGDSYEAIAICGGIIAFLWHNLFSRNKVFMGDAGSMFLGLAIAWLLVEQSQGSERVMSPVTALWIFAMPLVDTVAIMVRRVLKGQSPFLPDREHLHHLFLRAGFSDRQTLLILTLIALACASVGIVSHIYLVPEWMMFVAFLTIFFCYLFGLTHAWVFVKNFRKIVGLGEK
ncbi:MAG: UDP-N-acetylglucosamine--undecaprenyl-phosphate N-acetylglucosaminephosphotransferase [Gammaproteobacteria bacterium]|nr:UDP-N-acetylglucosamine--undecaprenyl-phosphate N-acetylglucosaminephosphotransferase [Gammaproteobacteria bacterium]